MFIEDKKLEMLVQKVNHNYEIGQKKILNTIFPIKSQ